MKILLKNNRGTPEDCLCRILVFRFTGNMDPTNNPSASEILVTTTGTAAITSYRAIRGYTQNKVKIYYDKTFRMNVASDGHAEKLIQLGWKLNHNVTFNNDATGDVNDVKENGWWIMYMADVELSANAPAMVVNGRIRFIDI